MALLIENALAVLTPDAAANSLLIEDGAIRAIGHDLDAAAQVDRLDASGCVVIPGLVNLHHHMFQSLTRAQGHEHELFGWLGGLWPLWQRHDARWQGAAAAVAAAELLLSGCTTTVDHHYLPPLPGDDDALAVQVDAVTGLGMRFVAAIGSMDVDEGSGGLAPAALCEDPDAFVARADAAISRFHDPRPGARVQVALAPCHPLAVTEHAARSVIDLAHRRDVRLHTHSAEARGEEGATVAATGLRPIELLDAWGFLGPRSWLAHCVHVSDADIELLAARRASVALCPSSNLRLGSGIARARDLLDAGVTVALGVDGSASNDTGHALGEARQLLLTSRAAGVAGGLTPREALHIATAGGAAALGRDDIGQLVVGRRADLAIFDVSGLASVGTEADPLAGLLLAPPASARDVLVDGEVVVHEHRLVARDADEIAREARAVVLDRLGGAGVDSPLRNVARNRFLHSGVDLA